MSITGHVKQLACRTCIEHTFDNRQGEIAPSKEILLLSIETQLWITPERTPPSTKSETVEFHQDRSMITGLLAFAFVANDLGVPDPPGQPR